MREKLCVCERRLKMVDLLRIKRQMTRFDLAKEFNVSCSTISRDIVYLSRIFPIDAKPGNQGGIVLGTKYRQYSLYLSDKEEECLYSLYAIADDYQKTIIQEIINKFTKNTVFEKQSI